MLSDVDDGIAARRNGAREEKREEMLGGVAGVEEGGGFATGKEARGDGRWGRGRIEG